MSKIYVAVLCVKIAEILWWFLAYCMVVSGPHSVKKFRIQPDPDPHNWVTCYSTPLTGVSLTGSRISTRQPGLPSSQLPGQLCHCFCLRSVSSMFPLWAPFFNESPVQKSLVLCPLQSELGTRNFSASQRQKGIVSVARLLGWLSQPVWPLSSTVLGREKGNNENFYII